MTKLIDSTVYNLKCKKIKLICIDFDNTLISIHTYGKWNDNPKKLVKYVRPIFIKFIKKCLQRKINIAIVSFSPQEQVIRIVLNSIFGKQSKKILIKTTNQKYKPDKIFCKINRKKLILKRKVPMILSVCNKIYKKKKITIMPPQILLIDDDYNNINIAKKSGFKTYLFNKYSEKNIMNDLGKEDVNSTVNSKPTTYTFIYADACKLLLILAIILFLVWRDRTTKTMGSKLITFQTKN